jgi:hypothetical protein
MIPTYQIAMAAGQDAGNRSMRDADRTAWNEDDYNTAAKVANRLLDMQNNFNHPLDTTAVYDMLVLSAGKTQRKRGEKTMTTTTETTVQTAPVSFTLLRTPSNSKGWARYSASVEGKRLIESRTGNEFVSASHTGSTEAGKTIAVTTQVALNVGKGRTSRQTTTTNAYTLIAEPGAHCEIGNSVCSLHIAIDGARLA